MYNICRICGTDMPDGIPLIDGQYCSPECRDWKPEKKFVRGQLVMFKMHSGQWVVSRIAHAYFANMSKRWRYEIPNPGSEAIWDLPEAHLWDAMLTYDQPSEPQTAQEWAAFHRARLAAPLTAQQRQALRDIAASPEPSLKYDRDTQWLGVLFEHNLIQSEYELVDGGLKYIGLIVLPDGWKLLASSFTGELSVEDADILFEAVNRADILEDYEITDDWGNYFLADGRVIYVSPDGDTSVKES